MSTDSQSYPGARWWKFDFHTHTPASSDYGSGVNQKLHRAITHREWLLNFITAGIECIAVTDHHSGDWIDALKTELTTMQNEGIPGSDHLHLFPGVELSICGVHYLAIFGEDATTQTIKDLLARARYDAPPANAQGICNELDPIKICEAVTELGGLFLPAHVDLDCTGLFRSTQIGTLKPVFECEAIIACEVAESSFTMPQIYMDHKKHWSQILGSDSHHPTSQSDGGGRYPGSHFTWVKMGEPSLEALRLALLDGNGSGVRRSDEHSSNYDPNQTPDLWIESLEVRQARLMGRVEPATFDFSPWLNSIIGGRGSGKSTLVHFIRLTGKRENDLSQLPRTSRVREGFESFALTDNGLTDQTEASLIYNKGAERYRLQWKQTDGGTTVESWEETSGIWMDEDSQEVTTRFPITIFSQDQIGTLAENSQAILQRIDEAIDKPSWQRRWDDELETFLKHLAEVRRLRRQLGEKDRLTGQLTDLTKKLGVFEKSEHASILKTARRFQKQRTELFSLIEAHNERASGLEDFAENLLLYDLSPEIIDRTDNEQDVLSDAEAKLRTSIATARSKLIQITADLREANNSAKRVIDKSDWEKARLKSSQAYHALVDELKEKGVDNPSEYSNLMGQKQNIEKQIQSLHQTKLQVDEQLSAATESKKQLLTLREKLQILRQDFLKDNLSANKFVQIELIPFGSETDRHFAETSLRAELGCEGSKFAPSFLEEDGNKGIIYDLYADVEDSDPERPSKIKKRLEDWKKQVVKAVKGDSSELSGHFANHLKKTHEARPETFYRFHAWWPEDSLKVSYSKGGEGRHFTPLANGSAGEKAAALLAFFLAYGDSPLVIDQPENDLDNHLITDLVVKQLQNNKNRRQIIVVTHNPNIVVNGDSEMVHAMGFKGGQCLPVAQGALQNLKVRDEVCLVMEGGERALEKRYQRLTS